MRRPTVLVLAALLVAVPLWAASLEKAKALRANGLGEDAKKELVEVAFEDTATPEVKAEALYLLGDIAVAEKATAFLELAPRMRIMGSLALSLCHLAAGRVDAVVSLKPIRSVDIAAGQLLVREQGLDIRLPDTGGFGDAPLDVTGRSRVVAGATSLVCERLTAALGALRPA